jgi:hypothetical protein
LADQPVEEEEGAGFGRKMVDSELHLYAYEIRINRCYWRCTATRLSTLRAATSVRRI